MSIEHSERCRQALTESDATLLASIVDRDPRAFEKLYRLHQPRLARFVINLVGRPWLVDEVVDDTLMVVWHRPSSYRGASRFTTWLFAIAYRKAMKARLRQDVPIEDPDAAGRPTEEPGPDSALGKHGTRTALAAALGQLSADHRAVVDLTYFHELSYREIAEIMNCPVDTVKTRMFHARRNLRRALAGSLTDWL